MSVLIKDMEMPEGDEVLSINIFSDGKVIRQYDLRCETVAMAEEFPTPHGRLIDADLLIKHVLSISKSDYNKACILQQVDFAPTVIEAEKEE